jgi:hypothetical protein
MNKGIAIAIIVSSLSLVGCAGKMTVPISYHASPNPNVVLQNIKKVGVVQLKDNRRLAKSNTPLSKQTILKIEGINVGITYENEEYAKVTKIMRSGLIEELKSTGADVTSIETLPANADNKLLTNIAKSNKLDIIVYGVLDSFETYCVATFVYTCDSQVTLTVTALKSDGSELVVRESFGKTKTEHKLDYEKLPHLLVNDLMKSTVQDVTARLVERINSLSKKI